MGHCLNNDIILFPIPALAGLTAQIAKPNCSDTRSTFSATVISTTGHYMRTKRNEKCSASGSEESHTIKVPKSCKNFSSFWRAFDFLSKPGTFNSAISARLKIYEGIS